MAKEKDQIVDNKEEVSKEVVVQEEKPKMTDAEAVDIYLKDEKVTKNLTLWAEHFEKRFHGNWFTVEQIVKKTAVRSIPEGNQYMGLIILKGMAVQKEMNGVIKFKITFKPEERIKLLEEHLATIEQQAASVRATIEELKTQIGNTDKK
jgi:hypothetical protein